MENRYSMMNNLMKNNNVINYDPNSIKSIQISENFFNCENVDLISTNELVVSRSVSKQSHCAEKENYPPKLSEKLSQESNLNANNLKKFDEDNNSVWRLVKKFQKITNLLVIDSVFSFHDKHSF